jgi:hypothetical protein
VEAVLGYLDPGSGSVILQVVLGGVAAAAVAARFYWKRITSRFRKDSTDGDDPH